MRTAPFLTFHELCGPSCYFLFLFSVFWCTLWLDILGSYLCFYFLILSITNIMSQETRWKCKILKYETCVTLQTHLFPWALVFHSKYLQHALWFSVCCGLVVSITMVMLSFFIIRVLVSYTKPEKFNNTM